MERVGDAEFIKWLLVLLPVMLTIVILALRARNKGGK